jgi:hypothetical protein
MHDTIFFVDPNVAIQIKYFVNIHNTEMRVIINKQTFNFKHNFILALYIIKCQQTK